MSTNPLHEKMIEEFKEQFTCKHKNCCDGNTIPNTETGIMTRFLRTAFLQIEQATREECAEVIANTKQPEDPHSWQYQIGFEMCRRLIKEAITKLTT